MPFILRDYQQKGVNLVREEIIKGHKRVVMVMPTGAGKSACYAEIIKLAVEKKNKCLFLVHRRHLVTQMIETLNFHGISDIGIIMAGHTADTNYSVQVATIQTLSRRLDLEEIEFNRFFFDADIVLVDECHCSVSKRYQNVLDLYKEKIIIGCSATPLRADQRGLGEVFDSLIDVISVHELTEAGFLAKARYFVPTQPDLDNIKISRGDYEVGELGKRMNQPKLVGDIVDNWLRIAPDRKTIVFCVNVKHAISVAEAFCRAGVTATHLSAKSSDDVREQAFRDMDNGLLQVICNVALYVEGMDCPDINCVVMARPTKSLGLYRQACGRGLRPSGTDTIIIDHGGVIEEHGPLDDDIEWSLDGKEKAWKRKKKKEREKRPMKCSVCSLVFEGADKCPDCGSPVQTFGKPIEVIDAELVEFGPKKKATMADKRMFYGMMKYYVRNHNKNPKMVDASYKEKFGVWPRGMDDVIPIRPDTTFDNWLRYKNIRYAKSKQVKS